jgi:glucokinase
MPADRKFVVVSGIPGSGKSSLALQLAPLLGLAVIDKDDILERLFDSKGVGDSDWRRTLSRESDLIFRQESEASQGALLVSHWHLPGMSPHSGTPTGWLVRLSGRIVNLHCACPAEVAAARFIQRIRHPGHLDKAMSRAQILTSIRELVRLQPPAIGERVSVDTSAEIKLEDLVFKISKVFDCRPHL